jgi:hypothetical protein
VRRPKLGLTTSTGSPPRRNAKVRWRKFSSSPGRAMYSRNAGPSQLPNPVIHRTLTGEHATTASTPDSFISAVAREIRRCVLCPQSHTAPVE